MIPLTHALIRLLVIALFSAAPCAQPRASARPICTGDCNGNHRVSVDELIIAVRIALGVTPLNECSSIDTNGDGEVRIGELISGVNAALHGCARQRRAFILSTNFGEGFFGTIDLDPPRDFSPKEDDLAVHEDAAVRSNGTHVFILNRRFRDTVRRLDSTRGLATDLECSVGALANPHDIAFAREDKAYVTRYDAEALWIVDPTAASCNEFKVGEINLAPLADSDGIPDMDQMAIVGDRLYVTLQRLDQTTLLRTPAERGAVAVIDTTSDRLVGSIELSGENPFSATKGIVVDGSDLVIAQAGRFGTEDGGIERVDTVTERALGFAVREADLGGDITDFTIVDNERAYAIVSYPDFSSALIAFDPATGTVRRTIEERDGFELADIELNDRGELYLADRTTESPGVRIYDAINGTPLGPALIEVELPPFEIIFID